MHALNWICVQMTKGKQSGKAAGGHARAKALGPNRLSASARNAAAARWSGDIKQATHGSDDHPLRIGSIELGAYVLEDETRVLSQRGLLGGLGLSRGGRASGRLADLLRSKEFEPFVSNDLLVALDNPIKFHPPHGGRLAFGYSATILADICEAVLATRNAGKLQKQHEPIADRCEILVRGFARVGIIALVDEVTGYQRDRARDALAEILEAFIAKELQPYIRLFPDAFYEHLFRLRGLEYPRDSGKRPQYFGHLTNDIVYARLAPGVLEELRKVVPRRDDGRRKYTFTRQLTEDVGHPKLREHLASVVTIMKLSGDYDDFAEKLDRIHPRFDETFQLPLEPPSG
jgi:P63C domain